MQRSKLPGRTWFNLILFGLVGQIAWAVENMYFNTFLYNGIYLQVGDQSAADTVLQPSQAISYMVAFSAVAAFVAALLLGTLSDRMNRRKIFMTVGYVVWGIVTASFGLISLDNTQKLFPSADAAKVLLYTVWMVIIMDVVMTFMGAIGNDAGFNAWVTDITDPTNRPVTETVLAAIPIAATGIVLGLAAVVGSIGYAMFFLILGGSVTVCGIVGLFTIHESRSGRKVQEGHYLSDVVYGFRPSVIKSHASLYLAFAAVCLFNIGVQVFFPYIIIYLQHCILPADLGAALNAKTIILAVIGLAILVGGILFFLKKADAIGRNKAFLMETGLFVLGLLLTWAFGEKNLGLLVICIAPAGIGYATLTILLNATVRDLTPEDKAGQFQGVRMIFYVLLPMTVGPAIGDLSIRNSAVTYLNEYGVETVLPTANMFLVSGLVSLTVFIPLLILLFRQKKEKAV